MAARWKQLKTTQFDTLSAYIDENAAALNQSEKNNFARWPILSTYVYPNAEVAGSYQGEVNYLKSWLTQRIAWMDSQLNPNKLNRPPIEIIRHPLCRLRSGRDLTGCAIQQNHGAVLRRILAQVKHVGDGVCDCIIGALPNSLLRQKAVFDET